MAENTQTQAEFLENFDWNKYQEGIDSVQEDQLKNFEELVKNNFVDTQDNEVVEGVVTRITDREAIIDINAKSEGVISLNEFRYNPNLKVGDKVEVLIDIREDKNGQLVLSHRKARTLKAWDRINLAHENVEIVNGFVKSRTKGGMIVDVFGIEAFLPGSQIDVKPIRDYEQFVNKTMEFKIVKVNHEFKNVVVSHKALIEADIEEQKKEIISQLEKGQVLEGVVKNITSYGVFVDLGGVDGLIHITDLSWARINHPSEVVSVDQKLNVVILDFDDNKSRIQLGLKQLSKHPWDALAEDLKVSQSYISQIENEKKIPSLTKLFEITESIASLSTKEKCEQDGLEFEEYNIKYQKLANSYIDDIIKNIHMDSVHNDKEKQLLKDLIELRNGESIFSKLKTYKDISQDIINGENIKINLDYIFRKNVKITIDGQALTTEDLIALQILIEGIRSRHKS